MKKQGPCCHCGIKSTPLWRNGPPGKPVLCNACGSRWRTKGTLANYFPQHALRFSTSDSEDSRDSGEYELPCKRKTKSLHKINQNGDDVEVGEITSGYCHKTSFEDNMGNRSSSGSGLSFSDNMSSVQLASSDGKDTSAFCPAGSEHLFLKEPNIPSRKRTSFECHSPSPVEKLRRELVSILQEQESSCPSQFSEEVLLFENQDPTVSVETSLGSLLIKHPVTSVEESQASSMTKENEASYLNDCFMVPSSVQAPFRGCEMSSSSGDEDRMRRNLREEKSINEPAAKRRALASLFLESSLGDHPYSMKMPRNCSSTDIFLQNVSTARLSAPRPLKEWASTMKPLASMRPLSSMDPTILAPGRDSVVPNPMKTMSIKPFCEVSLTSASDASSLLQAPLEMERLCRMNRPT